MAKTSAETTLDDGTTLRVEVDGSDALARSALDGAVGGIAKSCLVAPPVVNETGIVGKSQLMLDLFSLLSRIRNSNATVLIAGENGTGKELVARSIHAQSKRGDKSFVATNCSAFNDNLLESELFGHKRGAFTGAIGDKPGLFQVADKGTFFLDEVGDMSPALQVKLLRVLQEGMFLPVGATEHRQVDVRIIAATNRDLQQMVRDGTFREDLYYRLHVVALTVPALRDRSDDVPRLVRYFLARLAKKNGKIKSLSKAAMDRLRIHRWPGNVRELENEIERLWVLSGDDELLGEEHLSPAVLQGGVSKRRSSSEGVALSLDGQTLPEAVESLERQMIADGLQKSRGNKTRAAEALGISRRNLIRKVQAYGLENAGKSRT